jgi:hypothetical protein
MVSQGSFTKAGRFRYSDRWRTYNSGALFYQDGTPCYNGPLPGYCHYPNIAQYNDSRAQEHYNDNLDSGETQGYVQLDLFNDYAQAA